MLLGLPSPLTSHQVCLGTHPRWLRRGCQLPILAYCVGWKPGQRGRDPMQATCICSLANLERTQLVQLSLALFSSPRPPPPYRNRESEHNSSSIGPDTNAGENILATPRKFQMLCSCFCVETNHTDTYMHPTPHTPHATHTLVIVFCKVPETGCGKYLVNWKSCAL